MQFLSDYLDKNPNVTIVAQKFYHDSVAIDQTVYLQIVARGDNGAIGPTIFMAPALAGQKLPISLLRTSGTVKLLHEDARYLTFASSWYYMTVAVPVGDIEESLHALRITFAIAIPISLIITLLIGYTIARRGLRPIDNATAAARRITSQNLRERLPSPKNNDEVGRLVQTMNAMIGRLEESFNSISEFTTNAAHELRTPLTILRGEMEIELRKLNHSPEQQTQKALIQSNIEEVNRLIRIVENLFTLSRADSKDLALSLREVKLGKLLEKLRGKAEILASSKTIAVQLDIQSECTVIGDGEMLTQIVLNITENAVKYSPSDSVITIRLQRHGEDAVISVIDKGIGIDEEHKEKIFERFYRADKARSRAEGGTGLGLAIAHSIIKAHNGMIRAESAPGEGSKFIITLPLAVIE
jgi:heavy metal sensor kinase